MIVVGTCYLRLDLRLAVLVLIINKIDFLDKMLNTDEKLFFVLPLTKVSIVINYYEQNMDTHFVWLSLVFL